MPPEVRARFDDYAKNNDFQGHMKYWNDHFVNGLLPDLLNGPAAGTGVTNNYKLTDGPGGEWEKLYFAFQKTFQNMDAAKNPSIGFDSDYNKATKDFIAKWFGSNKLFDNDAALPNVEDKLTNDHPNALVDYLRTNRPLLQTIFKANNVVSDDFTYDNLLDGLDKKEYNSQSSFRKHLRDVIDYINGLGPNGGAPAGYWPMALGALEPGIDFAALPADFNGWFQAPTVYAGGASRIDDFKTKYSDIFSELLDPNNASILKKFLEQAESTISKPLKAAIEQTDYANKDSKDYIPEKYPDEKNWIQELQDWKDDTYENHFRRFTNPSRGTRLFFSPWSQNIIKAFDKEKIKPTDGIDGILSKKDAILKKLQSSKTSMDHFKWFAETIENLKSAGMGKAVEGALHNGKQMQHLVSAIIAEAVEKDKIKEAKTALEILSVAKYGLSSSRTMNALSEATKNMKLFSDEKLSWNKNDSIKPVTAAIDKTAGLAIRGVGMAATGIYNFIQHRRTKIGSDISNNKVLNKAHKHWNEEDLQATMEKQSDTAAKNLTDLSAGLGASTHVINAATIAAERGILAGMAAGPAKDNLQKDIDLYDKSVIDQHNANTELTAIHLRQATRAADPNNDKFRELIAYWDMLETRGKSHSFWLGSMKVKRDAMLKDYTKGYVAGTTNAHSIVHDYLDTFNTLRTA